MGMPAPKDTGSAGGGTRSVFKSKAPAEMHRREQAQPRLVIGLPTEGDVFLPGHIAQGGPGGDVEMLPIFEAVAHPRTDAGLIAVGGGAGGIQAIARGGVVGVDAVEEADGTPVDETV